MKGMGGERRAWEGREGSGKGRKWGKGEDKERR